VLTVKSHRLPEHLHHVFRRQVALFNPRSLEVHSFPPLLWELCAQEFILSGQLGPTIGESYSGRSETTHHCGMSVGGISERNHAARGRVGREAMGAPPRGARLVEEIAGGAAEEAAVRRRGSAHA
jgi:hypothetical protein